MILDFRLITVFRHPGERSRSAEILWTGCASSSLRRPHQGRRERRGVGPEQAAQKEPRRKLMAGKIGGKDQTQSGTNAPGPDVMLGLWASWMDRMAAPGQASSG